MVTHYFNIKKWGIGRFKEPCRVLARGRGPGPRNVLIEFSDGHRMVTIRHGIRRLKEQTVSTYNQGSCFNCAEPTTDFDYIGRTRVYVCDDNECLRAFEEEQRADDDYRREDEYWSMDRRGHW